MADIESQVSGVTEDQPTSTTANPQLLQRAAIAADRHITIISNPQITNPIHPRTPISADSQPQATSTNDPSHGNALSQTAGNPDPQQGEKYADSSDGVWSMYLTEAEKQDNDVTESWKGDTDGILIFTGLFSAVVAAFIIESYKNLSPNSADKANALLAQITQQLVNISNGTPLSNAIAQTNQPFKPTASAVRVNVLFFLSLVLSLTCALSATLMQQWARRYKELAQQTGAPHKRGRIRACIFQGIRRFGMARAIATMPLLLHASVFLFFAGLLDFLFPIYKTVSYTTLVCVVAFALAYAILTVLPNLYLNCPYATPLSGITWRLSQVIVIVGLKAALGIENLLHNPFLKLWGRVNQHITGPSVQAWRESLKSQVKIHRQWLSDGLRKSIERSSKDVPSVAVATALEWTLTTLDEDNQIETFVARMPGFFDSRTDPDVTSAILPLMSEQTLTNGILGTRLYDLLMTCMPGTSLLDDEQRMNRLQVCLKCLCYFGRAYNQSGVSEPLPSYFPTTISSPEIIHSLQMEQDPIIRVMGRCFGALVLTKLAAGVTSSTDSNDRIGEEQLACLSAILGIKSRDVRFCLSQPGVVQLAAMVSLALSDITLLTANILPSDVLELVQQTLDILSETFPAEVTIELPPDWPNTLINVSGNKYDRVIVSRLGYLLQTCVSSSSTLTDEVRGNCLQMSLKSLWNYAKVYHQLGTSESLPPYFLHVLATPEITHHIRREEGTTSRVLRYCFEVLVVTKLAADFNSRAAHVSDRELACLSTIFGTQSYVVEMLLRIPGAIEHMGLFFLVLSEAGILNTPFHTPMPTMFPYPAREPIPMFPYPTPIPTMFPYPTPNPAMFPYSEPLPAGYPYPSSMPIRDGHPSSMPTRARYPSTMHLGDRYPSTMPTRARYPATMPLGDRYPSTMPTRARYPATMPLGGPYSSTMPTRARYPPTIPLGDHYPSTMPTRARYSSTMPTGAHYPTPMPTGSHYPIPNPTIPSTHVPTMSTNHIYPLRPPSIIFTIPSHPSSVSRSSFNSERAPFPFPTPMFPFRSTAPVNPHITVTPTASSIPSPSTSQISLASMSRISDGEQSDLWDVVQQTFAILSLTLPAGRDTQPWLDQMHNQVGKSDGELKTILQHWLHDLLKMCTIEFPLPESEERIGCLKSLWYHEIASYYLRAPGSLPTLDLFPLHFFTPEIAHRIHAEEDNVVRVIGRCFASLVVNRRAVKSKPFEDHELGYLTAILSTENRAAIHQHFTPGVVQLINVVFLAFGEVSSFVTNTTPPYVLHIVGQTIGILTQSLPAELSAGLQLNRAESRTNVPDSLIKSVIVSYLRDLFKVCTQRTFPLPEAVRMHCVQMCLYGLWCWGKVLHQLDASQPLPPEFLDLAGLEITGHTRTEVDKVTRVMGSCVEALVVKNLVVRMNSRTDSDSTFQISDKELACVSAILGTESHDLRLWLSRPGAVELATEVSLVFSEIDMLFTYTPPSDVLDMVQETCNLVSFQVPYELYAELLKSFEGLQPLTEPNHSPLRQSLKRLWQSAKACNALGISVPLPSFVPITLASPEFTRCLHMERDLPTRVIGRCAQALIVNKLVDDFQSHISLSIGVYDAELASISSLLAIEPGEFSRWPRPSAVIKLQNIVFLMSGEIENLFSSSETTPTDALHVVQQTLNVVCSDLVLGGVFASGDLPMDQIRLLREIRSKIANVHVNQFSVQTVAEISDQLLTAEILDELQQLLKHMPTVELKMRRCTSTIFDLKSVEGQGGLMAQPEYEVRRRRSGSV